LLSNFDTERIIGDTAWFRILTIENARFKLFFELGAIQISANKAEAVHYFLSWLPILLLHFKLAACFEEHVDALKHKCLWMKIDSVTSC
jgi:hypothetical protein